MSDYSFIPAAALGRIAAEGGCIIDVRTHMEHEENRIDMPHDHVPLDTLDAAGYMLRRGMTAEDPVYILCRSGNRAKTAADKFRAAGYANIHVIEGGLIACQECGQTVTGNMEAAKASGKPAPLPLERQVRIAAGAFVALGALLGFTLSPVFHLLSLFVGFGLIFAGVTDRCGMALVLTKAPWNKTGGKTACATSGKAKAEGGCA